ncbi:MAG: GntR family transcriptional regulator [Micromonosporaceae bacterium]|nr:GntR family transcriptional regulator [Micromonosporaceae bacterium]
MASEPTYQRVAAELRAAIASGDLDERLPSLAVLAQRYGVTSDIARSAVDVLRAEGLVTTRRGSGVYVRRFERITRRSPERLGRQYRASGRAVQDSDTGPRLRVVDIVVSEQPASSEVAEALGVEAGQSVLTRSRRFLVDNRPVQLATSFLPLDIAGGTRIAYTDAGPGGTYARLAELGHEPVRFTERLTARAPNPDEVERLDLGSSIGSLVLDIVRFASTEVGRCVEVNQMTLDATAYILEYDFMA